MFAFAARLRPSIRGDAAFNFQGPGPVRRTIKARGKFSGDLRAGIEVKAQCVGKKGFSGLWS
jgi:hypothetical protein